jgi:predicted transcriptional regulator
MSMTTPSPTISIRLPAAARRRLDKATKLTRRSRSFLMQEALERHLAAIVSEETGTPQKPGLASLLALGGRGASVSTPRSAQEIDDHIRWLRDNE